MARERHVKSVAQAIRRHGERNARYHNRGHHYAIVTETDPIEVELADGRTALQGNGLLLSQWVEKYDLEHSVDVGDTLLVTLIHDDWVAVDVLSDKELS